MIPAMGRCDMSEKIDTSKIAAYARKLNETVSRWTERQQRTTYSQQSLRKANSNWEKLNSTEKRQAGKAAKQ